MDQAYAPDEVVSALQKSIRRGLELEAVFWAHELLAKGAAEGLWRRLCVIACEDVDDREALVEFMSCLNLWRIAGEAHGANIIVTRAVMALVRARKGRDANFLTTIISEMRRNGEVIPMPDYAVDVHTRRGRRKWRGGVNSPEWFLSWIREGQLCTGEMAPSRWAEEWVRRYGARVKFSKEQLEAALAEIRGQYKIRNARSGSRPSGKA